MTLSLYEYGKDFLPFQIFRMISGFRMQSDISNELFGLKLREAPLSLQGASLLLTFKNNVRMLLHQDFLAVDDEDTLLSLLYLLSP